MTTTNKTFVSVTKAVDQISGASGVETFPPAAPAANGVSIAEVLRYVSENQLRRIASKVIAAAGTSFTTAASPVSLFTVTGDVLARVYATVQTGLTSTSSTGTIAIGVTGNTGAFIAATTADGTNFPTGSVWAGDTTPTVKAEALSSAALNYCLVAGGADIIATIATNNMTAGAITFYCEYLPLSSDGAVVAA